MMLFLTLLAGRATAQLPPPAPALPPYNCPSGWTGGFAPYYGRVAGSKCYREVLGADGSAVMNYFECEGACAAAGGSPPCISTLEENLAVYDQFVATGTCKGADWTSCIWIGLTNIIMDRHDHNQGKYHWDKWSNDCGSGYRNWDKSQPNGGIGYYDFEDQNCVMMGFEMRPQWWDINCTSHQVKCVCETGGVYATPGSGDGGGGGISGFGVFMLILIFGCMFMMCGFYHGRPEKKAEHLDALKAKIGVGAPRARTGISRTNQVGIGAGLAANDSCSSYTAPLPAVAITPGAASGA